MSLRSDVKRKLKVLTVNERMKIIKKHAAGWKNIQISTAFGVPQSNVSTVVKNKAKWIALQDKGKLRKQQPVGDKRLEKAMELFVQQARDNNLPLSGILIREKAVEFAGLLGLTEFKGSSGWLTRFVNRQKLSFKKLCVESASVDVSMCDEYKEKTLPELTHGYDPKDTFNADETTSFYKCLPDKTFTMQSESCHGGKYSKQRITILCAINMDGTEELVIGKSKEPRCFKNIKSLPISYESNTKAWMTSVIFEKWLKDLDKKFGEENRKVLMFVDNCSAHPKRLQDKLKNINLQFFPPNATSVLQPLD